MKYLIAYGLFINLLAFIMMYSDKRKAIKRVYRISEKTLFFVAIIGGSIGSILGMYLFRHKTKHRYFTFGMPLILIIQLLLGILIYKKLIVSSLF